MAWTIEDLFPDWGEEGEFPTDGFFYDGGDQVNEKHLDALWNGVKEFEGNVRDALSDLDSDGDGVVDDSDQYAGLAPGDGVDGQALTTDGSSTQWSAIDPSGNDIAPTTLSVQDWNWVDVTEASDVATDGSADAVAEIQPLVADDTLLIFPEGTYRFDGTFSISEFDNVGMVARGDVTIESNNGTSNLIEFSSGEGFYLDGFDIDVETNSGQGGRQLSLNVEDRLHVKDITQVGAPTAGDSPFTTVQVTTESGRGRMENVDLTDGDDSVDGNGHIACLCSSGHLGTITFENCHVDGFMSNGMYLSGPGRYHVRGGSYKNCSTGQLRLNGGPAYVEGAEIVVDDPTDLASPRGVWWRGSGPHHIENCEIRIETESGSDPISVPTAESPGGLIENTQIRDERNGWATRINATDLDAHDDTAHDPLIFDGVQWEYNEFYGDNDEDPYGIRVHRPSTYFRDCDIEDFQGSGTQTAGRHAVQIRAANVHFRGGTILNDGWSINVEGVDTGNLDEYNGVTLRDLSAYPRPGPGSTRTSIVIGGDGSGGTTNVAPTEGTPPRDVHIYNADTNAHTGIAEADSVGITDFGVRTLIDGVGKNQGDPNEGGDWFDDSTIPDYTFRWPPGTKVVDEVSGTTYEYNGQTDDWVSFEEVSPVKDYETVGMAQERQDIRTRSVSAGTQFASYDRLDDPDHLHVMVGSGPNVNFNTPTPTSTPTAVSLSGDDNGTDPLRREVTVNLQDFDSYVDTTGADKEACAIGRDYYAIGDVDGNVHIRTINSPAETLGVLDDADSAIANMDFGENILAVSTGGSETYYYEIGTWNLLQNISAGHPVDGISVGGTDDEYVALGARGGYVRVYDTSTWTELHEFTDTSGEIVRDVDMDDEWLVYGSWDSNTYVRPVNPDSSTAVGSLAATLDDHVAADVNVEAVAVAGGYVFHGGGNNEVYVYDTSDFSLATTLTEPGFIQSMGATENDLTPGGSDYGYFAVGDGDGNANVYDIGAWNNVDTYSHSDNIFGVDCHEAMTVRAARANGDGISMNEYGSAPFAVTWGGDATINWDSGGEVTEVGATETIEIRLTSQDGGYSWRARTVATY